MCIVKISLSLSIYLYIYIPKCIATFNQISSIRNQIHWFQLSKILLEILNSTPNAERAAEVLLGIFEENPIPETPVDEANISAYKTNMRLVKYNRISQVITFSYNELRKKEGFWLKDVTKLKDNIQFECSNTDTGYERACKHLNITLQELHEKYEYGTLLKISDETYEDTISSYSWLNTRNR